MTFADSLLMITNAVPIEIKETIMPATEISNNTRLPILSIAYSGTNVAKKFTAGIDISF